RPAWRFDAPRWRGLAPPDGDAAQNMPRRGDRRSRRSGRATRPRPRPAHATGVPCGAHSLDPRPRMFTTVASYLDPIQAQIARGLLAAEGIDAHVGDEHLALANWEWRLAIGGTRVRVAEADAERACAILHAMEAGEY